MKNGPYVFFIMHASGRWVINRVQPHMALELSGTEIVDLTQILHILCTGYHFFDNWQYVVSFLQKFGLSNWFTD